MEKERTMFDSFLDFCRTLGDRQCEKRFLDLSDGHNKEEFLKELESYSVIAPLLNDPAVEDIIINGIRPIYVHRADAGLQKTDRRFSSAGELDLFLKKILSFAGKEKLKKINNIDLPNMRGRVNIVYSPQGPDLTITKLKSEPLSIISLIENKTLNADIAAQLWLYIEGLGLKPANILISGGPGSGKTTILNALLSFIPSNHHVVVIEDTFELVTEWIGNVSRLESDEELSLAGLVKNSLRMRPDHIIIGEVRGAEAQDMMTAMNIGKYCLATIHASTDRETIIRLQSNPMGVSETLINLIDVFIVMRKMSIGERVVRVVEEVAETAGLEQKTVLLAPLWKFDLSTRNFNMLSPTTVYRDKLAGASGLSGKGVLEEIGKRAVFLENLSKAGIRLIKDVSFYCDLYIRDPEKALGEVKFK